MLRTLMDKWQQHKDMVHNMTEVIKQHGLNSLSMTDVLARTIGVERIGGGRQGLPRGQQ